jgi:hypothetical protein
LRYRPEGFISVDETIFYFIRVIVDREIAERPWISKYDAVFRSVNSSINRELTPESQRALAAIDACLVSPQELWSQDPDSYRVQATRGLREALLAGKLYGYVFHDSYIGRIPSALWSVPKGQHFIDDGQITLKVAGRELLLKCWLRYDEIRDYFAGVEVSSAYPLLDADQVLSFGAPDAPQADPQSRLNSGGRPATTDWAEIAADTVKYFHENGRPENQSKLIEHLQLRYAARHDGKEPGTSTVKKFVTHLWKELGSYDKEP